MGDAGGPGRQRVRHRRHAPVVDPPGSQTWAGPAARARYGRSPLAPPSAARVPAFVPSRASPRCGHGLCVRSPSAPPRFVRAATDAHVHETCVRSPSAPPRSVPLSPGRLAAGCQWGSAHAGEDAPSPPRSVCLAGRTPHPPPRGACLDRPAQQLSVGPGRSSLITCRTCRKVSKLRGESLPCRQPWTATCPIGSVLLPSSRPLAGGAAELGTFSVPWADVPLAPPRRVSGARGSRLHDHVGVDRCPRLATDPHHPANTGRSRAHLGRFRSKRRDPQPRRREVWYKSVPRSDHPCPVPDHRRRPSPPARWGVASTAPLRPPAMRAPRVAT